MSYSREIVGQIMTIERLDNSKNGNPRHRVTFFAHDEVTYSFRTKPDAQVGTIITNLKFQVAPVVFTVEDDLITQVREA